MKFDKNSVIGISLLAILFIGYFYFTRQGQLELEAKQKHIADSLAALQPALKKDAVSAPELLSLDTVKAAPVAVGSMVQKGTATEVISSLENELVKISFTNKGARPHRVELKKYKSADSTNVELISSDFNKLSYLINTGNNETASTDELYFVADEVKKEADGSSSIAFKLQDSSGKAIVHKYSLKPDAYLLDWQLQVKGADKIFTQNNINLVWQVQSDQHELDIQSEKRETQLGLLDANGYDYFTMRDGLNKSWESGLKWLSIKQKFFNTTLIADQGFSHVDINCKMPADSLRIVSQSVANMQLNLPATANADLKFSFFMGPNDYQTLRSQHIELENIVNLGQGVYAFVKYINRWVVMPVFDFIQKYALNYGLAIALLTIFIRLLTSPLIYSSYVSGAKMKALRPELDAIKAKFEGDQQTFSMEQMKLYRSAGVNPLGGCVPGLLQIPIFFALYAYFNANIDLRGVSFWWSKDLSSFDAVFKWGFNIPGLGNHLSLFTILAVVTNLLIALYSMNSTPDSGNPALKYMPYIFPVMLLGIFNGLPSALTWYYTVSNVITLVMQFVIQTYIIDHNKILAEIEANKKKPKEKSKWQERFEQMQETQKKVNSMKDKTSKK
ncbi:MAG: rane protein insertase YidC [Bacteroidota bacterium]|jgi:YidC/Oxa1 family membrane protein insertase|nr:membrane protein insertase YidC [Chitinophagia bacterium]